MEVTVEDSFHRKSNVVFGQRQRGRSRTGHIIEFGELAALVKGIFVREAMQHGSHPPGEPLHLPDAPQADLRICIEQIATSRGIKMFESPGENAHIGDGEIQSFSAGRRHDVGGVSRQEELPVLHGLDYEAPHPGHAFLQNLTFGEFPSIRRQTCLKFPPNILVTPSINVFIGAAL